MALLEKLGQTQATFLLPPELMEDGDLVRAVSAVCGGKGGGKPDSAMGGGTELLKVDDALASVDDFVSEKLS